MKSRSTRQLGDAVEKHGDKDWAAVAALVPGRTNIQYSHRWTQSQDPSIALGLTGKWTEDEAIKLRDAVQKHGDKDWAAVAKLVPGRTALMCGGIWRKRQGPTNSSTSRGKIHAPLIDRPKRRTGKWEEDEDVKLKNAVQLHGCESWGEIAMLVPGRSKVPCQKRWESVLDPSIDKSNGRRGYSTRDEDNKLKDAVKARGSNDWIAVATLIPGRTNRQCLARWNKTQVVAHSGERSTAV
jgi:hypothetical protein